MGRRYERPAKKGKGEKPRYLLNAMYEGESIGLKVKEVGEKENEISCLPEYLKLFELNKTIVTIDAMGCNQTVIQAIVDRGRKLCHTGKRKPEKAAADDRGRVGETETEREV